MPVTEIALLHLKTPTPSDPLKAVFLEAQQEQSQYSGHRVNFLRSLDDQRDFFLLGGWESVALHCGEWVASEINQRLLAKLKDEVDIGYMFHLDVDPSTPIPISAPVIGVVRCFIEKDNKEEFDHLFKAGLSDLEKFTAPHPCFGGWRIDKEGEDEEFILLSGWNSVEHHHEFHKSELSKEFAKTKSVIKNTEVKHVRLENWE
ncbi:hypothetical protein N7481_000060 [Penicillium waksmanii]|uniref:uncharacterized protein n=1 Tax=Penicillium waksmanii TaxID=69791 RepID=UPI002546CCEF|nr:uncharacterized protein N7481_000060 [Penicillium waksmanii]KAJ5999651.1 hypothetical protein N7481_000060 [Penicillium waksmanii]